MYSTADRYEIAAQEDRSAPRVDLHIPAQLRISGQNKFPTVVSDLSLGGFCAVAIGRIHPGTVCWLTLPGLEAMMAEVIWWEGSKVGCAFNQLLGPIVYDNLMERWQGQVR